MKLRARHADPVATYNCVCCACDACPVLVSVCTRARLLFEGTVIPLQYFHPRDSVP